MIEKIILDFLNESLEVPVLMEKTEEQIEEYVLIEKTGSSEDNFISSATIAIQSYSSTLYKAAVLNKKVKIAMRELVSIPKISKVKLNTDYNFTDTTKKQYRYQAVYDITYQEGDGYGK